MSPSDAVAPDTAALAADALGHVLDLPAAGLRADTPLADLGVDSIARIQWADVAEARCRGRGLRVHVDDDALAAARTLADLAAALTAGCR